MSTRGEPPNSAGIAAASRRPAAAPVGDCSRYAFRWKGPVRAISNSRGAYALA
ncbi:MAG TPA: hypothetical protein VMV69_13330 [Pirellulales bacterium]|nr:hypothetical protein [Pirellulales bacterium]